MRVTSVPKGRYVVAVSGGVDSMVLFDVLRCQAGLELIVAHFDHGMRADSADDCEFVAKVSVSHNAEFAFTRGNLGPTASEAAARTARYNFLRQVGKKYNANAIITAHHQDDLLETALINLWRGTGPKGLASLTSRAGLLRPFLAVPKQAIVAYAKSHNLAWREDSTNQDRRYLRNYLRHEILAHLNANERTQLLDIIVRQEKLNQAIDKELTQWLHANTLLQSDELALPRYQLLMLPSDVAVAILRQAMQQLAGRTLERPLAKRALLFCKTAQPGKQFVLGPQWHLTARQGEIVFRRASTQAVVS